MIGQAVEFAKERREAREMNQPFTPDKANNKALIALLEHSLTEQNSANLRAISADIPLKSWVEWVRSVNVKQHYWWPLLPAITATARALVFDDTYGNLSSSLGLRFEHVVAVCKTEFEKHLIERKLENERVRNVAVVTWAGHSEYLKPDARYDALFLVRLSSYMPASTLVSRKAAFEHELDDLLASTSNDCLIVYQEDNEFNYRTPKKLLGQFVKTLANPNLSSIYKNKIRDAGFNSHSYYSSRTINLHLTPPANLVDQHARQEDVSLGSSTIVRLKKYAQNNLVPRNYSPTVLVVSSPKEATISVIEAAANSEKLRQYVGTNGGNAVKLKQALSGNDDVSIFFLSSENRSGKDVVARVPLTASGLERAKINSNTLLELENSSFKPYSPRLLDHTFFGDQHIYFEEKKEGRILELEYSDKANTLYRQANELLTNLQLQDAINCEVTEKEFSRLFTANIQPLKSIALEDEQGMLDQLNDLFKARLIGKTLPLVRVHGDFKPGNVLFSKHGIVTGIIDWDLSVSQGLPLFDQIIFSIYHLANRLGLTLQEVFVAHFLQQQPPNYYLGILEDVKSKFHLDEEVASVIVMYSWMMLVLKHLPWYAKAHGKLADSLLRDTLHSMLAKTASLRTSVQKNGVLKGLHI